MKMNETTSLIFYIVLFIVLFFWIADTKITFSPFSFKCENLQAAFGWILILIAIPLFMWKPLQKAELKGYREGAEDMQKEIIKILDDKIEESDKNTIKK